MLKPICFITAVAFLSACQSMLSQQLNFNDMSIEDISSHTIIESSEFDRCPKAQGLNISEDISTEVLEFSTMVFHVRSWLCDTPRHQVYISIYYSGSWRLYRTAKDENANLLDITEIDRNVNYCSGASCRLNEDIGINFTESDFKKFQNEGFRFRLESKSGHKIVFTIPSKYFQGYALGLTNQ